MKKLIYVFCLCLMLTSLCACTKKSFFQTAGLTDSDSTDTSDTSDGDTDSTDTNSTDFSDDSSTSSGEIYVQVSGAVNKPGVYKLSSSSRVYEAIEEAGGLRSDADDSSINQAEKISDGQKIDIPSQSQTSDSQEAESEDDGLVNINTADADELMTLPGIGESKAEAIIKYRESNGSFSDISDLMNISGIKEGVFNKISDKIKV